MENQVKHIILFDGVCNLCNGSVQFIIKRDKHSKFRFASLQSEFGQDKLLAFHLDNKDMDSFVYVRDGKVFTKSTAGLMVLKDLGGLWKILYLLIIFPKPLRDWFYNLIAKNRYKMFGKKESCMLPSADLKSRFLG